jgi:hypothetical protein
MSLRPLGTTRLPPEEHSLTLGAGIIFSILAHAVYKMWIIQKPNKLEFLNKLHFEENRRRI